MSPVLIRATAFVYLAAAALTCMPVTAGLLGWCPCGCMPDTLVYQQFNEDGQPHLPLNGEDHDDDSRSCHGCHPFPYCPLLVDAPLTGQVATGSVAVESNDTSLPHHVAPPIRPPRA